MNTTEILRENILGMPVEIFRQESNGLALVFVNNEYAGSAERDDITGTWGAFAIHRGGEPETSEGMWSAIDGVVREHMISSMKAAVAR